ncbi:MAG: electron transport complex subunit E [candidate division KSB1 bacterium]|nr:electron transport complex subunit E [candidate division KSB1 bacterium]MDZ7339827.1 electron transport complex subunit E [candidate division KSB1 bacterium]
MSASQEFLKGLYKENPIFRVLLGLCPALATSNSLQNAVGMGAAATFVLFCSNSIVSMIRKGVPNKIRIPIYIVVIATFVTLTDLTMQAFAPALSKSLGVFVPLIVVNCIILGRAEAFAGKNSVLLSMLDGLGMGIGFTFALSLVAIVRELLGTGKLWGIPLFGSGFEPMLILILPPGAFITLGLFIGFFNWLEKKRAQ